MLHLDQIPKPPDKPDPLECCGGGCVPCIFDYYEQKLIDWEKANGLRLSDYQKAILNQLPEENS